MMTWAMIQVLRGYAEETRWLRHAEHDLRGLFPYLPGQSGYNKRLRKSTTQMQALIRMLAAGPVDVVHDDVWLIDSTPVECGRSRQTAKRSDLAGWAGYGYCASHPRWFWGLHLHLVATPAGLPITFALTTRKSTNATSRATCSSPTRYCSLAATIRPSWPTRATGQSIADPQRRPVHP